MSGPILPIQNICSCLYGAVDEALSAASCRFLKSDYLPEWASCGSLKDTVSECVNQIFKEHGSNSEAMIHPQRNMSAVGPQAASRLLQRGALGFLWTCHFVTTGIFSYQNAKKAYSRSDYCMAAGFAGCTLLSAGGAVVSGAVLTTTVLDAWGRDASVTWIEI